MPDIPAITVDVWGARGTFTMPGPGSIEFGGHTSCVEVRAAGHLMIFDAGSGIMELGKALMKQEVTQVDLFLSHAHYDHLLGLPYFQPAYSDRVTLRIWAGHMLDDMTPEDLVAGIFHPPYFPITKDYMRARVEYRQFKPGDVLEPARGVRLKTGRLKHPNGAVGYRVEYGGATFAYLTDFEHDGAGGDAEVKRLAAGADLAFLDATYAPEEYPRYIGFGHSTWRHCGALCREAKVRRWGMFHHMHLRADADQRRLEAEAQAVFPNAFAVRERDHFEIEGRAAKPAQARITTC